MLARRHRATRRSRPKRSSVSGQQTIQNLDVSLEDPDFIGRAVLNRLIYGFHPYGLPDSGMPETHREDHPRRPPRIPSPLFRAEQQHPRDRRRRDCRRGDGRRRARVRRLAAPGRAAAAAAGSAASDAPYHGHRQARLRADGGARRAARHPAQVVGLHEHGPGHSHPWRRRQQPACSASFARSAGLRIPHPPT